MDAIFLVFQQLFRQYVDIQLALLIVISAYFFKKFLCNYVLPRVRMEHKVLLWATLISVLYYFAFQQTGVVERRPAVIYFITYFFATSFYELIFQPLERWVKKMTATTPAE
jgi:hypothetical protein